jgi:hypothetical protein
MATLMQRYSLNSDTATYGAVFDRAAYFREPETFSAAKTIAGDGSASTFARAASLLLLANFTSYQGIDIARAPVLGHTGTPTNLCDPGDFAHSVINGANPLPADHVAQALALGRSVMQDPTAPNPVRWAASCLHGAAIRDSIVLPSTYQPNFNPGTDFELIPACGSNFTFRNHSNTPVAVLLVGPTALTTRWITLPIKASGEAYSEVSVHWTFATLPVHYGTSTIATETTNPAPCP